MIEFSATDVEVIETATHFVRMGRQDNLTGSTIPDLVKDGLENILNTEDAVLGFLYGQIQTFRQLNEIWKDYQDDPTQIILNYIIKACLMIEWASEKFGIHT